MRRMTGLSILAGTLAFGTLNVSRAEAQTTVFSNAANDSGLNYQLPYYGDGTFRQFTYFGPENLELFSLGLDVIMYHAGNLRIAFSEAGQNGTVIQEWSTRQVTLDSPLFFAQGNRLINGQTYSVSVIVQPPANPADWTPVSLNDAAYYGFAVTDSEEAPTELLFEVRATVPEPSTAALLAIGVFALAVTARSRHCSR